jgi:hypothetical protein
VPSAFTVSLCTFNREPRIRWFDYKSNLCPEYFIVAPTWYFSFMIQSWMWTMCLLRPHSWKCSWKQSNGPSRVFYVLQYLELLTRSGTLGGVETSILHSIKPSWCIIGPWNWNFNFGIRVRTQSNTGLRH